LRPKEKWQRQLEAKRAEAAVTIAHNVATRLRSRERIEAAVLSAVRQTNFPKSIHWQPATIGQGFAGLAVMHGHLDACFPGEGWGNEAHRALQLAVWDAELRAAEAPGLFAGLSGLAFAVNYQSCSDERYVALIEALEGVFLPTTNRLAAELHEKLHAGASVGSFDVITGLSGIGAYLLCRRTIPSAAAALAALLRGLISLTGEQDGLPHWHTPPSQIFDEVTLSQYPHGQLNCGLAHGAPGVLALLALAKSAGVLVAGLAEAIERLSRWVSANRCDDAAGVNWPNAVPLEPATGAAAEPRLRQGVSQAAPFGPSRSAWCYGAPGVARALWLSGVALDDTRSRELAISAMQAIARRSIDARQIDSPTFCHGVAGLLQITLRFAHDTGLRQFTEFARILTDQLLGMYDADIELGYSSLEPGRKRVDQPGLLDGAAGIPLVLLAAATDVDPSWDRLFLLS
jgi:lantibiotic biosynthesis protein